MTLRQVLSSAVHNITGKAPEVDYSQFDDERNYGWIAAKISEMTGCNPEMATLVRDRTYQNHPEIHKQELSDVEKCVFILGKYEQYSSLIEQEIKNGIAQQRTLDNVS